MYFLGLDVVTILFLAECVDGYFGFNCSTRCEVDICKGSDVCNKTNGECLNGCKYPGYQVPECIAGKWY